MANFDFDDPIGDLLSDGSNDSFFEEPKALAKRSSLTKTDKKDPVDLFGLSESKQSQPEKDHVELPKEPPAPPKKPANDWLELDDDMGKQEITKPKTVKKTISFEDDDDILSTLNLGTKTKNKPEEKVPSKKEQSNKSSLFNDILGVSKGSADKKLGFHDILSTSKYSKKPEETKNVIPQTQPKSLESVLPLAEGRRSRRPFSGLDDPLGLFKNESKSMDVPDSSQQTSAQAEKKIDVGAGDAGATKTEVIFSKPTRDLQTKSTSDIGDLPEWLGGTGVKQNKSEPAISNPQPKPAEQEEQRNEMKSSVSRPPDYFTQQVVATDNPILDSLLMQQKLTSSNIKYQNASLALQQQESQVLVAMQLKKYEEGLIEMQRKQQEILRQQEQQFNTLMERQFAKQQIMESNMRLQQERINNQIQFLLSQPPVTHFEVGAKTTKETKEEEDGVPSNDAEFVSLMKQRQHEEMFLMEESYKKQITLLEQAMEAVETRLKSVLSSTLQTYQEKLHEIEMSHQDEIKKYKNKIQEITQYHAEEIKLMRESHLRATEELKQEYSTIIENLQRTRQIENELTNSATEYSQKLDTNLKLLGNTAHSLLDLHDQVKKGQDYVSTEKEAFLKVKEEEIKMMRNTLEKSREAAESERAQLMGLVRTLEGKLAEQSQNAREERWALQQAAATLTARASALDRESEFNRALLEREREQIKTLKESLLAEQEKQALQLTEERLALQTEKSRLETAAKLHQNHDPQKAKAEVEAAIQVAKEAAELTDKERENLLQKQHELEVIKRSLHDREQKLSLRERELHALSQQAENRIRESQKAMDEAKMLEIKYNERLKDIQNQLVSLTNRERKLAEEKIALSRERVALHALAQQTRRCRLCTTDNTTKTDENYETNVRVEQDLQHYVMVMDPDLLRLRMLAEDEQNDFRNIPK